MTDPTLSPQVRDVDRELADWIRRSIEGWMNEEHVATVIAGHLAPEREEAAKWKDTARLALMALQESRRASRSIVDRAQNHLDEVEDYLMRARSAAPAPQGEKGGN